MEGFDTVRALARRRHGEACAAAGGKTTAADLLDGATAITGHRTQLPLRMTTRSFAVPKRSLTRPWAAFSTRRA